MKKKLLGLFLLMCLLLLGTSSFEAKAEETERYSAEVTYVNPLYADVVSEDELKVTPPVYFTDGEIVYQETVEAAGAIVRDLMEERAATITVGVKYGEWTNQVAYEVFDEALAHTGVPTQGDYLAFTYGGWNGSLEGYSDETCYYITITYSMQYYTTAEQEAEMNTAVDTLLTELALDESDDYAKVCGIYDYMCDNIVYDYDNLNDASHKLKYTAYAALVNGTSVCQGYANLFYRLALELGVDTRIIAGDAGGAHSWNIVKLGDVYYNVDATWDAGRSEYDYFLQNPEGFSDHTRDAEYDTEEFHAVYPMSDVDYSDKQTEEPVVAVYQDGELIGKSASMEEAFALVTNENGEYLFELIGSEEYIMPVGEWPKAKLLEFSCSLYSIVSIVLPGDVYLNSNVEFNNMSLDCAVDDYSANTKPTLYARTYTLYFRGTSNFLGGYCVPNSKGEVCHLGINLEGPEAALISNSYDRFEVYESQVNIGTTYMDGGSYFKIYGGTFDCDTFRVSEQTETTAMLALSSYYNSNYDFYYSPQIDFNVENLIIERRTFWIDIDSANENNSYRIGNLQQTSEEEGGVTIQNHTATGLKFPSMLTIEAFENVSLNYYVNYTEMYDYTKEALEALCNEAYAEGNSYKWNFYYDFLWYMEKTEQYSSATPDEILTYKGTLLNIGESGLDNLFVCYCIKNKEYQADTDNYTYYIADDFLEVDSEGNVSRTKDEVITVENGVLTKATVFTTEKYTLTIPEEATSIAETFRLDNNVDKVVIHSGVQNIENFALAFNYASEFVVAADNPYYTAIDGALYTKNADKLVAYPVARGGEFVIPDTVTEIAEAVFSLADMTKLTIPSSVETIKFGEFQWYSCDEYKINSSTVEDCAFLGNGCQVLTFDSNVSNIGSRILEYAVNIESVYFFNPDVVLAADTFAGIEADSVTIYGYAGSTAEEYVATYGAEYGLVFSVLRNEDVVDFVSRLYTVILERTPDEGGLAEWTGYLQDGTFTGAEVAAGFIMSDEFLNKEMTNEEFVKILYSAFFGREADAAGLATWTEYLDAGYRKSYVFAGFANSTEFGSLCEGYGVEGGSVPVTISEQQPNLSDEEYNVWLFVERMYTEVLERTPDMGGIKEWVDYLQAGTFSGAEVASGFILSEEFLAKEMSNEEYVKIMYRAFFGREADPSGLETWVNALETSFTKEYVFAGFANSAEFGVLCESYGITRGSVELE